MLIVWAWSLFLLLLLGVTSERVIAFLIDGAGEGNWQAFTFSTFDDGSVQVHRIFDFNEATSILSIYIFPTG